MSDKQKLREKLRILLADDRNFNQPVVKWPYLVGWGKAEMLTVKDGDRYYTVILQEYNQK